MSEQARPTELIEDYEVICRFPGPPPAFKHDDAPEEVAIVRLPDTDGGVMIMARYAQVGWCGNKGNRAAVRVLLQEIERLRARVARLEDACRAAQREFKHLGQALGEITPPEMVDVWNQVDAALEESTP